MLATLCERNDVDHVVLNETCHLIKSVPLFVELLDQLLFFIAQLRRLLAKSLLSSVQIGL